MTGTELATVIKLIDKIVDFVFKIFDKKRQQEIEDNIDEIHKNPSDWFNSRYKRGMRDDSSTDGQSDGSPDDSKT